MANVTPHPSTFYPQHEHYEDAAEQAVRDGGFDGTAQHRETGWDTYPVKISVSAAGTFGDIETDYLPTELAERVKALPQQETFFVKDGDLSPRDGEAGQVLRDLVAQTEESFRSQCEYIGTDEWQAEERDLWLSVIDPVAKVNIPDLGVFQVHSSEVTKAFHFWAITPNGASLLKDRLLRTDEYRPSQPTAYSALDDVSLFELVVLAISAGVAGE